MLQLRNVIGAKNERLVMDWAKMLGDAAPATLPDAIDALCQSFQDDPAKWFGFAGAMTNGMFAKVVAALEGAPQLISSADLPESKKMGKDSELQDWLACLMDIFPCLKVEKSDRVRSGVMIFAADEAQLAWRERRSDILNVRNILDTLYSLAKASANLYGVISIDFFVDVVVGRWHADWVRLCKGGLPWQMLEVRAKIEAADLAFNQGDVVSFPIRDNNTRRAAIRGQHEGKTPWLPENEADFLAFGDYAELRRTAAAQEFRDVLRMDGGGKLDNRMVEVIVGHCNQEFGDDDVLNLVSCLTPRTMGVDRERIARILTDVSNTTRAWALFGHTAEELGIRHEVCPQDRMPEEAMRELAEGFPSPELLADAGLAAPKVGRNDPCPCGSGKKYKKCCGRNSM